MQLQINGKTYPVKSNGDTPLLWVIRDELGMTGTKYGCGLAQCGACSVLVDGVVTRSCVMPAESVAGRKITTIEAIEEDDVGKRVVEAWVKHQVPQCGYCQSGQVMAATALLKQNPHPTDEQVAAAMVNLCRCGTYNAIRAAVEELSSGNALPHAARSNAGVPHAATAVTTTLAGIAVVSAIAGNASGTSESERGEA
ncbi:(2Fe-2S)-binding protein [Burkholderia pyrrocinia]|uniref:(2Fe-2S)-binding protein n=1 Tax=Burkholderia pyrrocinia TaxID=60550 RepID=UPI002AB1CE03|nr:(2Fe-2S)-binding protein [Burkholderia pyrrocinia]